MPGSLWSGPARSLKDGVPGRYFTLRRTPRPPCTEGVAWNVIAQPITMSKAQIAAFTGAFAEPNNRPTQKLGSRTLVVDTAVAVGH